MKNDRSKVLALATFSAALLLTTPLAASDAGLSTEVTLLIGFPTDGPWDGHGSLVVPGAVIPVRSSPRLDATGGTGGSEAATHRALIDSHRRIQEVAEDLRRSLRLSLIEVRYWMPLSLAVGELRDLPPPARSSTVRLSIQLLGFNDSLASYAVQFFDGSLPLTDTPLTVRRGKQALVGTLDGEDAPYIFLMIAPAGSAPAVSGVPAGPMRIEGDIQPPLAIEKPPAVYTEEAKQAKVEGEVILETVIEKDGTISKVEVLQGLTHGLSEAAVEAIRQWRFEPALMNGEPVSVYYNLTINFRLTPQGGSG